MKAVKLGLWMVSGFAVMSVQAASIEENFDSLKTGLAKSRKDIRAVVIKQPGEQDEIRVVDSQSTPPDPFGGELNKSLRIYDPLDKTPTSVRYDLSPKLEQGSLTMDFYVVDDPTVGIYYINLQDSIGKNGPAIRFKEGEIYTFGDGITLDNTFTENEKHSVQIDFDSEADTWSGTLDGETLTADGGEKTTFAYQNEIGKIKILVLSTETTWNGDVYVDNLKVAP